MKADTVHVRIVADTRQFRAELTRCQILVTRSPLRRAALRLRLALIALERAPR